MKMLSSSESREFVTAKKFTNYKLHYGLDCQGDRPMPDRPDRDTYNTDRICNEAYLTDTNHTYDSSLAAYGRLVIGNASPGLGILVNVDEFSGRGAFPTVTKVCFMLCCQAQAGDRLNIAIKFLVPSAYPAIL